MKKVLSLVLAVVLVFGLSSVAFAAPAKGEYGVGFSGASNDRQMYDVVTFTDDINPDFEFDVPIMAWDGTDWKAIDKTNVRGDKLDVKSKIREGSKVMDSAKLKYVDGEAVIRVSFVDPFISINDQDFDIIVYLTKNKKKVDNTEFELIGTFANQSQEAYEDDDYVYLYDTPLVKAEDYIKSIEVDLGDGVSIFTKMFDGKKYYGYLTQEIKSEDDEIVTKYPAIDTIYYLSTINLNSAGNYVKLDLGEKMYIYNSDLEYIGTSNDKLPYSTKYYVASVELDVADADMDTIPSDNDPDNVPSGGDDVPSNVNENPGTGC